MMCLCQHDGFRAILHSYHYKNAMRGYVSDVLKQLQPINLMH